MAEPILETHLATERPTKRVLGSSESGGSQADIFQATSATNDRRQGADTEPLLGPQRQWLDPDDPRVLPLRLLRIRITRRMVKALVVFNAFLALTYLVSLFVSIPGFTSRGLSFLELDLALVCCLSNALVLWQFQVTTFFERLMGYAASSVLALDLILVLLIEPMRRQFSTTGCFLILWTGLNILFGALVDRIVEQARVAQEIRYTGRPEKRRLVTELIILSAKATCKLALLCTITLMSVALCLAAFDTHEKPWGKLVPVAQDSFLVHLACFGDVHNKTAKQPIVLVEGGELTSSEVFQEWIEELHSLDKIDRYCIWDRPGHGFSDLAPLPVSISIIADYLSEALAHEKIEGPFALAAFDIGGLYARVFAARHPEQVHSLLLVDSWHQDLLRKFPFSGTNRKNENRNVFRHILQLMDTRAGFSIWFRGLVLPLAIQQLGHWVLHPRTYSSKLRIFGRDMIHLSRYLRARFQEQLTSLILSYGEVEAAVLHDIPTSVILSDFMIKNSLNWGKWQREITKWSTKNQEWVIAENSGHKIWRSLKGKEQLQQLLLRIVSDKSNY